MHLGRRTQKRKWGPFRLGVALFSVAACLLTLVVLGADGQYVGEETCALCHEDAAEGFAVTAHGRAGIEGWDGSFACESCHGPGEAHVDSEGEVEHIVRPGSQLSSERCLSCHGGQVARHWQGSTHESFDLQCSDCHQVHSPWTNDHALANQQVTESCLGCHNSMRKHLHQRSSHPLQEGLMSCISCHDPHGSVAEASIAALTPNDKCYECHADKRGPYLFEHAPVREDCGTCHEPHGRTGENEVRFT